MRQKRMYWRNAVLTVIDDGFYVARSVQASLTRWVQGPEC